MTQSYWNIKMPAWVSQPGWWAAALIVVVGLVGYANTWQVPFFFDDVDSIINNRAIRDLNWGDTYGLYRTRVVAYITFSLNYAVGGLSLVSYHIVNFIIHVLAAIATYLLAYLLSRHSVPLITYGWRTWKITNHQTIGLLAGLLFVSHPVQTQAVTYIVQRIASLATLFYLLALLTYVRSRQSLQAGWWRAVSVLLTIVAMHTKEIAFTIPFAILGIEFLFFSPTWPKLRQQIKSLLPFALTLSIIPAMYLYIIPFVDIGPGRVSSDTALSPGLVSEAAGQTLEISRANYVYTQIGVAVTYLRLLVWPANQSLDYDYPVARSFFNTVTVASAVVLLLIQGGAFWLWRHKHLLAVFGIELFFLGLLVESSFFPLPDLIFEHRLYLPFAGFAVACAYAAWYLAHAYRVEKVVAVGALIVIVALTSATYRRNAVWGDPVVFWSDVVAKAPRKVRSYNNLGIAYNQARQFERAIEVYERALRLDPHYSPLHNNMGLAYLFLGRVTEAVPHFKQAVAIDAAYSHAWNNLGAAYVQLSQPTEATAAFQQAITTSPEYLAPRDNLGRVLIGQKRFKEAADVFQAALAIDPSVVAIRNNLGVAYFQQGKVNEAQQTFEEVLKLNPHDRTAQENLAELQRVIP